MRQPIDTLWYTRSLHPSPLGLAAQLGWFLEEFHDEGIDVFTLQETDDPQLRESHLNHHLVHSIRQGGNVPAIWTRSTGGKTKVIGLNWIDEFQGILSLPASGIRCPADLRDRRVGLPRYSSVIEAKRAEALHGFLVALELGGLAPSNLEFIDISVERTSPTTLPQPATPLGEYARLIEALQRGEVDAIYVKGARGLQAAHAIQAHVVLDIRTHPDPLVRAHTGTPRPITVDEALLRDHPDIVVRFLARVVAIGDWAASHPAETLAYVSRETKASAEWVKQAYGDELHLRQRTDLAELSVRALDAHKRFLLQWGFINHDFDTLEWIDPAPLAAVRNLAPAHRTAVQAA